MKYAQLVIGPAGSGKSTYCETIKQHCEAIGRPAHVVNLDPAAEEFGCDITIDIRDLISLEDCMEELNLGPNGGLLYCMEYLEENLDEWLGEELSGFGDDDYLLFDCPGQIELYSHVSVFRSLVDFLRGDGWQVVAVYCLDSQFTDDTAKFIAGCLTALSAMVQLEVPHVNILTKMDLCRDKANVEENCLFPDGAHLRSQLDKATGIRFKAMNAAVSQLLDNFSMVSFIPLDITDEDSVEECLLQVDGTIQFGEDQDVRVREFGDFPDDM